MNPFEIDISEEKLKSFLAQALEISDQGLVWLGNYMLLVKILAGIISLLSGAGVVWLVIKTRKIMKENEKKNVYNVAKTVKPKIERTWKKIEMHLRRGQEADLKLAVIEADKILNYMLEAVGYMGETVAERLKKVKKNELGNLEAVWRAHKIRNRIVHDPDYRISREEAEKEVEAFKEAFQEFGVL